MADERDAPEDRLRIDRWLWCARFFKSRSAAAEAVRAGHVRLHGQRVKPSQAVKVGDALSVERTMGTVREVSIASIPLRRGPASEAALAYRESEESIARGRRAAEERALRAFSPPTTGRPDKRTRRLLLRARQRGTLSEP